MAPWPDRVHPTRRPARRARRRATAFGAVAAVAALSLSGCVSGVDLSYATVTTIDCASDQMVVATGSGESFSDAAGAALTAPDETRLKYQVLDSTRLAPPLASGEITVGDWKTASSFPVTLEDRPVRNPIAMLVTTLDDADWTHSAVIGRGGCSDADIPVTARLADGVTAVDDDLPAFLVEAYTSTSTLASFDAAQIVIGGTAGPTSYTIDPVTWLQHPVTYRVEVTGVSHDGSITVAVPAGFVVDSWGATNATGADASMELDTTPPVLAGVPDFDAGFAALGASQKIVEFDAPTATDAHLAAPASCSPASGTAFGIGTTTVTCSASDTLGHAAATSFDVTVAAAPRAPSSLVISGPVTSHEGATAVYVFEAFNSQSESLGAPESAVTLRSSVPADVIHGDSVTFGFDPAAIGGSSTRTLTATLDDDPTVSATATVQVTSAAASIRMRAGGGAVPTAGGPVTVPQGGSITMHVDALDADGDVLGEASDHVVLTSDVASDVIDGTTIRFPHASPHTITATLAHDPAFTASIVVEVMPAPAPVAIASTGAVAPGPGLVSGVAALATGLVLLVAWRIRARRP